MLRAALRNRRSRLLFANYIRAFRAFSRSKNLTAVYAYRKAQETKFYGKLSPNLKSFFGDVFSQDKASKPPLYMHTARRKKRSFTGNSARTSAHFSVMFFRKTRLLSRRCICIPQGARNAVLQGTQPETSAHFSAMFFSQDKASKPPLYIHTARRKERSFTGETQPRTSAHFSVMFFRKTRLLSRRCICIPQGARNEVLRKNSPKNQISIMSASFFFAISSISLTYLSVIF